MTSVVKRMPAPGEIEREVRRVAVGLAAALSMLVGLVAVGYVAHTAEPGGTPRGNTRGVRCEEFGFPSSVPGVAPAVCWNGPIAYALDGRSRNAAWAMVVIAPATLRGDAVRSDRFRADPRVPADWRAALSDYAGTPYDRGHLIGSAFFGKQAERDATFALSNIAPQHPALNRGPWRALEARIRARVSDEQQTAVLVVLPLYPRAELVAGGGAVTVRTIGASHVWVPDRFAAAVLYLARGQPIQMEAWILPNDAGADVAGGRVSVDDVEREAALDLFWALDDEIEERLEALRD